MNAHVKIGDPLERVLQDLVDALQVPKDRRDAAERSYKSLGDWLNRSGSSLAYASPQVYVQGSFRLGTTIRPSTPNGEYDLDLVCELALTKSQVSQADLKAMLGHELELYSNSRGMNPPSEGRRCWTQDYHDGARFHLDSLPAIADGAGQRVLLERANLSSDWADTAIAITDKQHHAFHRLSTDWPHSNPKGYGLWFRSRQRTAYQARREFLALEARASVEDIPESDVHTPLQGCIQILKHHRDQMFADRCEIAPVSIIITTLAAHAYRQEPTLRETLRTVLASMDQFIEDRGGTKWIPNPTDGAENFADRWIGRPDKQAAFYEWLEQARRDFRAADSASNIETARESLEPRLRSRLTESVFEDSVGRRLNDMAAGIRSLLSPSHKQAPPWHAVGQGSVTVQAMFSRDGFRPAAYSSGAGPLPKRGGLTFTASTSVPAPYRIFWQVVNTGIEAELAGGLRGGFDEGEISRGHLTHHENTLYEGTHSIECFIVKDGYLAARSGQFIVRIS